MSEQKSDEARTSEIREGVKDVIDTFKDIPKTLWFTGVVLAQEFSKMAFGGSAAAVAPAAKAGTAAPSKLGITPAVAPTVTLKPLAQINNELELDHLTELPVWDGQNTPLYIKDIIKETEDCYTFRIAGKPLCRFIYKAGQFCTFVLNIDGKRVLRSYTISSSPSRPHMLSVTVKRVAGGLVSNWLPDHLNVGDEIRLAGPKGKFCLTPGQIHKKILFISAGSGVTPMMSMARWLHDVGAEVDAKFFFSVKTGEDIIFDKELQMLTANCQNFSPVIVTTSQQKKNDSPSGFTGRINRKMLEKCAPDIHERQIYMCGPAGFMEAVKDILKEMNFDKSMLHLESFGGVRNKVKPEAGDAASATDAVAGVAAAPAVAGVAAAPVSAPAAPPVIEDVPQVAADGFAIKFVKNGQTVITDGKTNLLDLAEENGIDIEYSCRSGSCGECKVRMMSGEVNHDCDDGLEDEDKTAGMVLTCSAYPTAAVSLDC